MGSFTDDLVSLIDTNFDTTLRVGYTNKCSVINILKYPGPWPTLKEATIAIFPNHIKQEIETAKSWREWTKVNKCIIKSYRSELDAEYLVDVVKEVLDNHQVTGNWKHWWDDERNISDSGARPPVYKIEGNIYSREEETY